MKPYYLPVALLAFACGCTPNSGKPNVKATDGAVKIDLPTKKPLRHVIEQPATIEGFQDANLVARISGNVGKVSVDIGQSVKPTDILAELDVPEIVEDYYQKAALVKQAKAEVDQAVAALAAADANIATAKALVSEAMAARARAEANFDRWKSEHTRVGKLVKDKVVDAQIGDETLNQYKAAEANRQEVEAKVASAQAMAKESEAKRDKAKADVAASEARVLVSQAEEGRAKAMADYRFIKPPFKGIITHRYIHPGNLLQPNASGGAAIVFSISQVDKLRIIADIPEAEAGYLKLGLEARIFVPALKDQSFKVSVARTSGSLDPKTRTLRVEIDYENDKESKLRPGMFANVVFDLEFIGRYTLPVSAVFLSADQPCCWRVVAGKAVRTPIKVGLRDGPLVEVLELQTRDATWEKITGSEEIIVANLGAVSDGKEINAERK